MKNGIVIKSLLIAGTIITTSVMISEASATMNLATRCKENFVGQVISVSDSQAPLSRLAMVDVVFSIQDQDEASSEKDSQTRKVTILRDGPNKFQVGQIYDVGLNQSFVCRMEHVKS